MNRLFPSLYPTVLEVGETQIAKVRGEKKDGPRGLNWAFVELITVPGKSLSTSMEI